MIAVFAELSKDVGRPESVSEPCNKIRSSVRSPSTFILTVGQIRSVDLGGSAPLLRLREPPAPFLPPPSRVLPRDSALDTWRRAFMQN